MVLDAVGFGVYLPSCRLFSKRKMSESQHAVVHHPYAPSHLSLETSLGNCVVLFGVVLAGGIDPTLQLEQTEIIQYVNGYSFTSQLRRGIIRLTQTSIDFLSHGS